MRLSDTLKKGTFIFICFPWQNRNKNPINTTVSGHNTRTILSGHPEIMVPFCCGSDWFHDPDIIKKAEKQGKSAVLLLILPDVQFRSWRRFFPCFCPFPAKRSETGHNKKDGDLSLRLPVLIVYEFCSFSSLTLRKYVRIFNFPSWSMNPRFLAAVSWVCFPCSTSSTSILNRSGSYWSRFRPL